MKTADPSDSIDAMLADHALEGERSVARARAVVNVLGGVVRLWLIHTSVTSRDFLIGPTLLGPALCIVALFVRPRTIAGTWRLIHASIIFDAWLMFSMIATDALFPWEPYRGLWALPDFGVLAVGSFATALRFSPRGAALGAVLNCTSFVALTALDLTVNHDNPGAEPKYYLAWGVLVAGANAMAVMLATRSVKLVLKGARAAAASAQAGRGLLQLLHEHHDVRSLLSSARLSADLLAEQLETGAAEPRGTAGRLRDDLTRVCDHVESIKAHAQEYVLRLEERVPLDAERVACEVAGLVRTQFTAVTIDVVAASRSEVLVAGGATTLKRMLLNLMLNACEGDGRRGAAHVEVRLEASAGDGCVRLFVRDDGPGFSAEALKPGGTGVGLQLVKGLASASGGAVSWHNLERGGAEVELLLPAPGPAS